MLFSFYYLQWEYGQLFFTDHYRFAEGSSSKRGKFWIILAKRLPLLLSSDRSQLALRRNMYATIRAPSWILFWLFSSTKPLSLLRRLRAERRVESERLSNQEIASLETSGEMRNRTGGETADSWIIIFAGLHGNNDDNHCNRIPKSAQCQQFSAPKPYLRHSNALELCQLHTPLPSKQTHQNLYNILEPVMTFYIFFVIFV